MVNRSLLVFNTSHAARGGTPALNKFHIHVRCFAAWGFECQRMARIASPNQATLPYRMRQQAAKDRRALLITGARLLEKSVASIERSGNSIIRSRAQLLLSHVRLDRNGYRPRGAAA